MVSWASPRFVRDHVFLLGLWSIAGVGNQCRGGLLDGVGFSGWLRGGAGDKGREVLCSRDSVSALLGGERSVQG